MKKNFFIVTNYWRGLSAETDWSIFCEDDFREFDVTVEISDKFNQAFTELNIIAENSEEHEKSELTINSKHMENNRLENIENIIGFCFLRHIFLFI